MDFLKIANTRQSCRSYDESRPVEQEKLDAILEAFRQSRSACNGQHYHLTVGVTLPEKWLPPPQAWA